MICSHYDRKCLVYTECCDKYYPCIHCHNNDITNLCDDITKNNINYIKCIDCNTKQDIVNQCIKCEIIFGKYFCKICKLYDNNIEKGIIHCDKCGICRVSKGKELFHCDNCNICSFAKHTDIKCTTLSDCPICCYSLWDSIDEPMQTKCNHWIHKCCFYELLKKDYKCPVCKKSLIEISKLEEIFDAEKNNYEIPEELKETKLEIICNDCLKINTVNFNFFNKCPDCKSYNTCEK